MPIEYVIAIVIAGFLFIVAASKSVKTPLRWVGLAALNLVIGAVLLFFANLVGEMAGFHLPINPVTALIAGFLRLPGLAALVMIKLFMM
ncbi:pro-sigmaK processing inhibitor BofA family protein [Brevibacillus humidisoli]|uniref:pro-sigmaK processing inhibitor BofA family protein n=1 Tax=Brevibacillus humidisoli TaxID=2895522 RepID=UPI001E34C99B|nr:pro-sigmaK processing inhibitor BofA family protein [Brevibacillus humidisoli]UFJ40511.1 pro-sigmaK processing inhibitor BofA family protein [Brevibacillus humidisoli]